jgi:hypothetical protein
VRVFSAVSLTVAALLALMAWGISHSVKVDLADEQLDRVIDEAVAQRGGKHLVCDCGHDHDYTEMHVRGAHAESVATSDDTCAHDGKGDSCTHNCVSCVMRSLRPSPHETRAERLGADFG